MKLEYFETLGSTQDYIKDLAAKGEFGPRWVRAGLQNSGRGRRGRPWISKPGNLFASGIYPWSGPLISKPLASFVVALAVTEVLSTYIDPAKITLKWPNDVLVEGAKISGILLEGGEGWLVIGVGMNLEHNPDDLPYPTTHLLEHMSENDLNDAEPLYAGADPILAQLTQIIGTKLSVLQTEGFGPFHKEWLNKAANLGQVIKVNLDGDIVAGTFETLSDNGALRLRLSDGTIREIVAGDVLL
ncbi:BirA family biotin operon repressor/biotin-[acetyl-CoA-carboxylase] ligase [Litorimonas taeanensis]|uniref:biotin--[biotin carboxyl-carrier protein] ligase n=1 Tax=Litorimonas taeanensis TaxID=568099 RepID=A0A420WKV0_9PROT|nr:biotin--[acetyl-CoA-carboxylase] ligase [Litorimonas taeanensis]RKQ71647.1 BirA family biotin operon repressor/biotin-[acetyl-CoA-carboxylase] ligase [Litorimonas taeanensis]